MILYLFI